jgi:multidrug transporter EmrE-like cation transporter
LQVVLSLSAGLASIALPSLLSRLHFGKKEAGLGALMALLRIGGQVSMAKALGLHVPGNIVFPVAVGGSILAGAVASWAVFKEKMNRLTVAGVILGSVAVILVSLS